MDVRTKAVTERLFPQRSSRWLAYALSTSFLIVLGGSLLMWGLFRSQPVQQGIADEGQQTITVLIDRTPGGPSQWTPYVAVLKQMEDQMRVPVRAKYVAGRAEVADAMSDPRIDAAFVSIYQYLALEDDTEWELLATPIVAGRSLETAVIAVRADSPYRSFEDLKGTRIALAPGASIRGYAYASWLAVEAGSPLDEFFGAVHTGGEHAENLERLAGGDVEAVSVGRSHLLAWPPGTFRVVSESPEMGLPPILMRTRLPEYFRDNLRAGLRGMSPGAGLPAEGPVQGFYFPTSEDYDFARVLLEYVDMSILEQQWSGSR